MSDLIGNSDQVARMCLKDTTRTDRSSSYPGKLDNRKKKRKAKKSLKRGWRGPWNYGIGKAGLDDYRRVVTETAIATAIRTSYREVQDSLVKRTNILFGLCRQLVSPKVRRSRVHTTQEFTYNECHSLLCRRTILSRSRSNQSLPPGQTIWRSIGTAELCQQQGTAYTRCI